jgi:UDP-glucose 4-epimerase
MGRIVILGHTGFIGRALQQHLHDSGRDVVGLSSRAVDLRQAEALRPLEDVIDRDAIVIFASTITREKGDTPQTLLDNVAMAANLGAFVEQHPPARLVCFSSDAIYPMQDRAVSEDTPVAPGGTFYAIAKYGAECVLRKSAEAKGIPLLVLRPTAVFGPGDTHNSYGPNAFLRAAVRDRTVRIFGQGEERRDHLYIGDLVRAVKALVDAGVDGTFNLATGVSRSFADVAGAIRRIVPFELEISYQPRRAPITHREFDVARLVRQLPGFQFTGFDQALRETYESFREVAEAR